MCRFATGPCPIVLAALTSLLVLTLSPIVASAQTSAKPLYGVTIDNIGQIKTIVSEERTLPNRPTTRVYFNVSEPASYYRAAVSDVQSVSSVMGELLDSSDATHITTGAFQTRVESYLTTLGSAVAIGKPISVMPHPVDARTPNLVSNSRYAAGNGISSMRRIGLSASSGRGGCWAKAC